MTVLKIILTMVKYEISINFHSTLYGVEECPLPVMKGKNQGHQTSKQSGRPAEMFWVSHCGIILMLRLVAH